jgi:MoaA/NifB/PqqE/SkfB family radical SAM enzyme
MKPTTRFVIEPSLECNIKCKFCYHLHKYPVWKQTRKACDLVAQEIDKGAARGNDYMDITGGEPTIYPQIGYLVKYALSKGIKTCIITNGIMSENKTKELLDAGVDDFLISRHGLADTHNFITNNDNAYRKQCEFLVRIIGKVKYRFNCVINKYNQTDILKIAKELAGYQPDIVNFINFNPHHQWTNKDLDSKEVVANLHAVEPYLNEAIKYLESFNIGVNVRYYPMCRIAQEYRRCVCNDLQVMFDPYEWDYCTEPKTIERYAAWGKNTSFNNEEKEKPCNTCDLQNICGGINKHFHRVANSVYGEQCTPQGFSGDKQDFYFYRKDNKLTLRS